MTEAALPVTTRRRRQLPGAGFVLLALALQAPLLLPWMERKPAPDRSPTLELRLWQEAPPEPASAPPPPVQPPPPSSMGDPLSRAPGPRSGVNSVAEPAPNPVPNSMPNAVPVRRDRPGSPAAAPADPPAVTVQRLRESLDDVDWPRLARARDDEQSLPARSLEGDLDEGWRQPVLALEAGPLDEAYLSGATEIVDRWQEPGGVHRVVIRTPDGRTLCGRQEPVNDFRPWEQMPMMFHRCAGGGRR